MSEIVSSPRCPRCSAAARVKWQDDRGRTHQACARCEWEDGAFFFARYGEYPAGYEPLPPIGVDGLLRRPTEAS
jgi:hypothetical protein